LAFYQLTVPQKSKLVFGFAGGYLEFFDNFFLFNSSPGDDEFIDGFLQFGQAFSPLKPGFFPENLFRTNSPGVTCLDFMVAFDITVFTKNLAIFFVNVFFFQFASAD
jgi:hypothetical protein